MDRRRALITLGLSSLAAPLMLRCSSASEPDESRALAEDDGMADFLFVQESDGVRFDGASMTLVGLAPRTLYFTDRPDEYAGYLNFDEFVGMVSEGPDSFKEDPPNATLVTLEPDEVVNVVMNLAAPPRLEGQDLVFPEVKIIEGTPPAEAGISALFIDTIGRPLSPGSVAGVHRRHRRRRRRRVRRHT